MRGNLSTIAARLFSRVLLAALVLASGAGATAAEEISQPAFARDLVAAAWERTTHRVTYDPSYRQLAYPMGDPPRDRGVCSDVVIRAYRQVGLDLQQAVHEDMRRAFAAYPKIWGLSRPDRNIDHRRVPNLRRFLDRQGAALDISDDPKDYRPGDLVTWNLRGDGGSLPHIGIVVDRLSPDGRRPLIVHNIGQGPKAEDILFRFKITGHFRYRPEIL